MNQLSAEKLLSVVTPLEENTTNIASNWVREEAVKSIFTARKISQKKFRDSYSIPIINYFISVIRKEKDAGDCPIMSKFVNYMLTKNITPREVFLICMGFRKALISFLLQEETVLKDPLPFMNEVAFIFDANLSGVLEIFTTSYADSQKKIEIAKAQQCKLQQTTKIINSINTKIMILQNDKITLVNKPFLEMTGTKNLENFYEKYEDGFGFFHNVNVYENEFKKDIAQWVEKVCKNKKHFKTNIYHELISKTLSYSGRITKLPSETDDQYIIALSNISEHIKDEEMLQDYLSHDEVTGFKNYSNFEKFLGEKVEKVGATNGRLFFAVVDIVNLREINTEKGREAGDKIVSEIAEDLRFIEDKKTHFARLEGSRFGILLEYGTEQKSYDWCLTLYHAIKERDAKMKIAATEVDFSQSINKLLIRSFALVEQENQTSKVINNDFIHVIEYKELENQELFTSSLKQLKHIETSLFFMELPVVSKVKVLSINPNNAQLTLSSKQMDIAEVGMLIYFKLGTLGNIAANISQIDATKRTLTINEFKKDTHSPLNRKSIRIQAGDDIKAYIVHEETEYTVKILNMSEQFIAIEMDKTRNLDVNSVIYLDLLLPLSDKNRACKADATVTRVDKTPTGYKLVLLCHLDEKNKHIVSQYISEQQMRIIKITRA